MQEQAWDSDMLVASLILLPLSTVSRNQMSRDKTTFVFNHKSTNLVNGLYIGFLIWGKFFFSQFYIILKQEHEFYQLDITNAHVLLIPKSFLNFPSLSLSPHRWAVEIIEWEKQRTWSGSWSQCSCPGIGITEYANVAIDSWKALEFRVHVLFRVLTIKS